MTDTTRTMIGAGSAPDIIPEGAAPMRVLATAINGLAGRRRELNATIAEQISTASDRVAQQRDQLAALMAEPAPDTPEAFGAFMKRELAKYERVVKASGAKVD